jgi:TP53 regulating kinase-like protein
MSMISQGAEGRLFEVSFLDKAAVCKERLRKSYRVSVLDEKLNKQRILQEARCIHRCFRQGVPVPMSVNFSMFAIVSLG